MQNTGNRYLWLAIALAGSVLLLNAAVSAESYTFSRNSGAWSPGYIDRSVVAPCHAEVSIKLSGARYDHYDSDIAITIEFRAPGVALQSPPTHTRVFMSKLEDQHAETFSVPGHGSGCGNAWQVRVKPSQVSRIETRIMGDLSLSFASVGKNISVEDAASLANGRSTTKNIGGSGGLHQGWVEITGTWNHSVFGAPGPLPVKLTYSLVKPNGDIAAFDTGHSNHEFNPCCSGDKLKLRFRIPENINGQWKLRITNDSGQDAMTIIPKASFKPACK
jgi:hypothetical protein